ncbi:MAG: TonB-dependent receptor [Bacteroidales bacterium]|uniref:TonB-dependent receptor domain-containing protein n=1 Tax=Porphyromonas sp. TaxID=1924944 RepID=UPI00297A15F1|nr:TonB-dependent receptor [Porphyromonas sp.]MDD7438411.1 TonB-dependent receptor [Bacteroidales bacterium]MDY3066908.1 TonB-dependent receptor [Porphyromonas sp.]
MNKCLWSVLAMLFSVVGTAQEVRGIVEDDKGEALSFATVKVFSLPDSVLITAGVTGADGAFALPIGNSELPLMLKVSMVGFSESGSEINALQGHRIILQESATLLGEVSVTANRIPHRMVAGGLSTSIDATPLAQLPDVYSVLRGVPLIEVQGEAISVTGKGTPIIYINDRLMTNPNQLRQLKPHLIKNIEVITNPGARYDATVQSVVKIYTKREPGSGLSGNFREQLTQQRGYRMGFGTFAGLNYRKDNWDFFVDGHYVTKEGIGGSSEGIFTGKTDNSIWINKSQLNSTAFEKVGNVTAGINYEDEVQSFGIKYELGTDWDRTNIYNTMLSKLDQQPEVTIYNHNLLQSPLSQSHRPSFYYLRNFGEWRGQLDVDYYTDSTDPNNPSVQIVREGYTLDYELDKKRSTSGAFYSSAGTRADFTGPLWGGSLNVGGEYSYVYNKFFSYNDASLSLPDLESKVQEQLVALYFEYNRSLGEQFQLTAGLRMEHLNSRYFDKEQVDKDKSRVWTNFFPTFSLSGKLWDINTQLSFRSSIERPSYWQLQPQYTYISRFEYQVGDPLLRPAIEYSTQLLLNKNWLTFILGHGYSVDCLTQTTELMRDLNNPGQYLPYTTVLKTINANPHHGLSATLVASPKIGWWQPTFTAMISKMYGYDIWYFDQLITNRKSLLVLGLQNQFALPHDITASLNAQYMPFGNMDNIEIIKPGLDTYAQISKQWLRDKSLTTSFSVSNFVNYDGMRVRIRTRHTELNALDYRPTTFSFTISYRFNSTKSKYQGTGALSEVIERM